MLEPVYPSLFFEGTEYPDVPADAAVYVTPLWASATGAATNLELRGNDGAFVTYGSFNAFNRRARFNGTETVRCRVLGFAVGFAAVSANFGATLVAGAGPVLNVYRDKLDDAGAVIASAEANLVTFDGSTAGRIVTACGPQGPDRIDPIRPDADGVGLVLTDHRVRFRVEVGVPGALPAANTPILGRFAVAMWPVPKAGAESLRMAG